MAKNYVVTGTSRGIGLEMARQLLEAGNTVFALARTPEKSKGLVDLKEKYPNTLNVSTVDVTSDSQVSNFLNGLDSKIAVDVLINNAGIYGEDASFEELSLEHIEKTFSNNTVAPMRMTRALLPWLNRSKNPKVIHITSLMGSIQDNESGGSYGYRISKAALNMFHKSFSIDYPKITSLVVHPGWVKTDMGGSQAPTEIRDSARGILALCEKSSTPESGKFFDFEGEALPW